MGRPGNRWRIAGFGALLHLCLGTVYAWSYFQGRLVEACGWSHAQVAWTFSLAIGFLGVAAAVGGFLLPKTGPRPLAVTGILLYGAGWLLGALALHWRSVALLWAGYGVVGGIGLGLGYVTPVATVARWFPDRKGLVTGMVVMGFGFGALAMSKLIAPGLEKAFQGSLPAVFAGAGLALGGLGLVAALFLRNPPSASLAAGEPQTGVGVEGARQAVGSTRFARIWILFFCNISAGIALIGFQSPLLQDLLRRADPAQSAGALAAAGATLIAVSSVCNGVGRIAWGALADRIGPVAAFRVILATQAAVFAALAFTRNPWVFAALVCYTLLCYGGGFGVMPAFVTSVFGGRLMPAVYGMVLTAWSCAGIAGPQLIAQLKDRPGLNVPLWAFGSCAALLAVGLVFSAKLGSVRSDSNHRL